MGGVMHGAMGANTALMRIIAPGRDPRYLGEITGRIAGSRQPDDSAPRPLLLARRYPTAARRDFAGDTWRLRAAGLCNPRLYGAEAPPIPLIRLRNLTAPPGGRRRRYGCSRGFCGAGGKAVPIFRFLRRSSFAEVYAALWPRRPCFK